VPRNSHKKCWPPAGGKFLVKSEIAGMMKSKGKEAPDFVTIYCQEAYGKIPKFGVFVVVIAMAKIYNLPFTMEYWVLRKVQ